MNQLATQAPMSPPENISQLDLADAVRSMAVLANLSISVWTAERTDERISAKLKADAGAVGKTGRYIKNLLAGCDTSLKELRKSYNAARTLHYKLTLPWVSDPDSDRMQGARLLPNLLFTKYISEMGALRRTAEAQRDAFLVEYPNLVTQAMANLAGLARAEDYPTEDQVRASFRMHFDVDPIPPSSAFANLPPDMLTALSRNLERRHEASALRAQRAMWEEARDTVQHLADRLAKHDGIVQEGTLEHVRELITLMPGWNVTRDPRVTELVSVISDMLDGITIKKVRDNGQVRQAVASKAQALTDKLNQWGV